MEWWIDFFIYLLMRWKYIYYFLIIPACLLLGFVAFIVSHAGHGPSDTARPDSLIAAPVCTNDIETTAGGLSLPATARCGKIATGIVDREAVVSFAESLVGTPYHYACTNPKEGFDCSGFVSYVFGHFRIKVPRASIDYTDEGAEVGVADSRRGDIILFTGTDSSERSVGHMGIVVSNKNGELQFIHASSGKAHGVVITVLDPYYKGRFVKVIRVFAG